jgi:hypothetical protein
LVSPSCATGTEGPNEPGLMPCFPLVRLAGGGVGEADLRRGGEVERQWRLNRLAPMKSRGGGVGGER